MNPEQAVFLCHTHLASHGYESPVTKKVIAAVPDDKSSYTPDVKSMSAKTLAWHIASAEEFFLRGILTGSFAMSEGDPTALPEGINTIADICAYYDRVIPGLIEKVRQMPGEKLAAPVDFFGMMNAPAVMYLDLMLKHGIHHRGQLSAYLRPMGAKVPGIYGPSADEPLPAAATAN